MLPLLASIFDIEICSVNGMCFTPLTLRTPITVTSSLSFSTTMLSFTFIIFRFLG